MSDENTTVGYAKDVELATCDASHTAMPWPAATSSPVSTTIHPPASGSVYDLFTLPQKLALLVLVCSCSLIVPMTDTIYIPSLERMKHDLQSSQAMAALSVAVYMLGAGVMALIWGPFADRFGRRSIYWVCGLGYIGATIGCMYAPSIEVLITLRAFQGGAVTGFMAGSAGIVADVFPAEQRGLASAVFSIPMLIGPVIGPPIGAAVTNSYNWRVSFLVLAIFAGVVLLMALILLRRESHQYYALKRIEQHIGHAAVLQQYQEAGKILAHPPVFPLPWKPLWFLLEHSIYPFTISKCLLFGSMFATLVILPSQLAQRQSVLEGSLSGLMYVPVALACFLAAPVGGKLADVAASKLHPCKQGRMIPSLIMSAVLMPVGLIMYGWALQMEAHLAVVLLGHAFVGAAVGCFTPAFYSYLSVEKQQAASAVASADQAVSLVIAGVLIQVSALAVDALGAGVFFTCLTAVGVIAIASTGVYSYRMLHQVSLPEQPRDVTPELATAAQQYTH